VTSFTLWCQHTGLGGGRGWGKRESGILKGTRRHLDRPLKVKLSLRLIKQKAVKMYCAVKVPFHAFLILVLEVTVQLHAPVVLSQRKDLPAKGLGGIHSQYGGQNKISSPCLKTTSSQLAHSQSLYRLCYAGPQSTAALLTLIIVTSL
jgi:hypothetical protein